MILMSHMGRPKNQPNPKYSLEPVARKLSELLKKAVIFNDDGAVTGSVTVAAAGLKPGDVLLLQNTRFRGEEEKNDQGFSESWPIWAMFFVNDAFGTAHPGPCLNRRDCRVFTRCFRHLIQKELDFMGKALENPERHFGHSRWFKGF